MKTLIIPDVHLKWANVDSVLAYEKNFDQVIFLGDYFDDFSDSVISNEGMAQWIKERIIDDRFIFLVGNHDLSYMYGGGRKKLICPGFTHEKNRAINGVLSDHWNRFKFFHYEHGVLFSHAGLTAPLYSWIDTSSVDEILQVLEKELSYSKIEAFDKFGSPILFGAGYDRGGPQSWGGILWCDHSRHFPIKDLPQIYGHSPLSHPDHRIRDIRKNSVFYCGINDSRGILERYHISKPWSLCLDTHCRHYAVIENGILTVKNIFRSGSLANVEFDNLFSRKINN